MLCCNTQILMFKFNGKTYNFFQTGKLKFLKAALRQVEQVFEKLLTFSEEINSDILCTHSNTNLDHWYIWHTQLDEVFNRITSIAVITVSIIHKIYAQFYKILCLTNLIFIQQFQFHRNKKPNLKLNVIKNLYKNKVLNKVLLFQTKLSQFKSIFYHYLFQKIVGK